MQHQPSLAHRYDSLLLDRVYNPITHAAARFNMTGTDLGSMVTYGLIVLMVVLLLLVGDVGTALFLGAVLTIHGRMTRKERKKWYDESIMMGAHNGMRYTARPQRLMLQLMTVIVSLGIFLFVPVGFDEVTSDGHVAWVYPVVIVLFFAHTFIPFYFDSTDPVSSGQCGNQQFGSDSQ